MFIRLCSAYKISFFLDVSNVDRPSNPIDNVDKRKHGNIHNKCTEKMSVENSKFEDLKRVEIKRENLWNDDLLTEDKIGIVN